MSGVFSKPKKPDLPAVESVEEPQAVVEDEQEVKRRKRVSLANQGRSQNILAGIQSALKTRLGE
jgi:hypothetical protein